MGRGLTKGRGGMRRHVYSNAASVRSRKETVPLFLPGHDFRPPD